jgi:hypothetical protein
MKIHAITQLVAFASIGLMLPQFAIAQTAHFEYALRITVDPFKRSDYLKQSGEVPRSYELVFSLVKGSMQVAKMPKL